MLWAYLILSYNIRTAIHITDCTNTAQRQWGLLLNVYSVYKSCLSFQRM